MRRRLIAALVLVGAGALVGCSGGGVEPVAGGPSAATADACVPRTVPSPAALPTDAEREPLPDVVLSCFSGGQTVHVGQLRGPAVINLWASWCKPCRSELPAFQRYARRAAGLVTVVGVNTEDTRTGGTSIVEDLELTFPMLVDERGSLRTALGRTALPVTVFVDGAGHIAHVYNAEALDEDNLELLVEQHLGVVVPRP